jgi:hypothetical protein
MPTSGKNLKNIEPSIVFQKSIYYVDLEYFQVSSSLYLGKYFTPPPPLAHLETVDKENKRDKEDLKGWKRKAK